MKKPSLTLQIIYRSILLVLSVLALTLCMGIWSIEGELFSNFNPLFFNDFFVWAITMAIVATIFALIDNVRSVKAGKTEDYSNRFGLLKFCTTSSLIFCFILGAFFVIRIGDGYLVDGAAYGDFYPAILTAGFWLDISVFIPRFVVPVLYIVGHVLFEEKLKTRPIYSTLGIVPPTIFYFFSFFLSLIVSAIMGGAEAIVDAGWYEWIYPYFFFDSAYTFTGWYWMLLWPTIFGVSLMLINNVVYYISRTVRNENGKLTMYKKLKVEEDDMCDIIHIIKAKSAAKKASKAENSSDNTDAE